MPIRNSQKKRKANLPLGAVPEDSSTTASSSSKKRRKSSNKQQGSNLRKFVDGLVSRLSGDDRDGKDAVVVEGAFIAALTALPEGRLKRELEEGRAEALELLTLQLAAPNRAEPLASRSDFQATTVVPCTQALYSRARRAAEKALKSRAGDGGGQLRALALNPRAPLDLLLDAMSDEHAAGLFETGCFTSLKMEDKVERMRILLSALAVDPHAAVATSTGLAFFTDRAAVLAGAIVKELTVMQGAGSADNDLSSTATEGLGLMLRVMQVAGMAVTMSTTCSPPEDGGTQNEASLSLLLPCVPETTGESASERGRMVPPPGMSLARLLAHYAVALVAVCHAARASNGTTARAFIKRVCTVSTGGRGGSIYTKNGNSSSSESDGDDDDDDVDKEDPRVMGGGGGEDCAAITQHLLPLCAGHLADETITLEFLQCVGNACHTKGSRSCLSPDVTAFLAPTCARAIARLPRPPPAPAPSATHFLKRAYASRVVESLNRAFIASKTARGQSSVDSIALHARPWDFVGAAAAPPSLLEFLGRPQAVAMVGERTAAGEALKELAERRGSSAAVGETLRSSDMCSPSKLGPLLEVIESMNAGAGDRAGDSRKDAGTVAGFVVDTVGLRSGGRRELGEVLTPLRGKGDHPVDMEEKDEEGQQSDGGSSDGEGGARPGFVVDTKGTR